jgi:hypothetical protein
MMFMDVNVSDAISAGVLTEEDAAFLKDLRIPYHDTEGLWADKQRIERLMLNAIRDGVVTPIEREPVVALRGPEIIGDYINGPGGAVKSMVDGKMYDSRTAYEKAVKAAGCVIMGNDAPTIAKPKEVPLCDRDIGRDIKTAMEQLGGRL